MSRDIDDYARKYHELPFERTQAQYRRKTVLKLVDDVAPHSLLEVGCGQSPLFTDLPSKVNVTLLEPSKSFVENAEHLSKGHENISVVQGFLEDFVSSDCFDMVLLSSVLHEVDNPLSFLKSVHRICRGNTICHINVPNARSLHRQMAVAMGLIPSMDAISTTQQRLQQTQPAYDLASLQALLEDAGFDVIASGGIFLKPFTHGQMQQLVEQEFLTSDLLDGFFEMGAELPDLASEIWVHVKKRHD